MLFNFKIGIDISKSWFNFCLLDQHLNILLEGKVDNNPHAICQFIHQLLDLEQINSLDDILLAMEHTGIYCNHLIKGWLKHQGTLSVIPAYKISQLLGGVDQWEEKTDEMDARRIAEFATRFEDKIDFYKAQDQTIVKLKALQRQRTRIINAINTLQVPVEESKQFDDKDLYTLISKNQKASIISLNKDLQKIEKQLNKSIEDDSALSNLYKLITSVNGVGPVIAREVLITTSGFTQFKPNQAKSFAKYCGSVPLKKESGNKKWRRKNSKKSNKKMKAFLSMGAMALIGTNYDLGLYYKRKIEEGKPHFVVLNNMRNKLILRIFAVVRNQTIYEKNFNESLV